MSSKPRRSLLKSQILTHMRGNAVPSVAALARALETSRPAVSRSLKSLADQGYVRREGRAWSLTEPGLAAAEAAEAELRETTVELIDRAGRRVRFLNWSESGDGAASAGAMSSLMHHSALIGSAGLSAMKELSGLSSAHVPGHSVGAALAAIGAAGGLAGESALGLGLAGQRLYETDALASIGAASGLYRERALELAGSSAADMAVSALDVFGGAGRSMVADFVGQAAALPDSVTATFAENLASAIAFDPAARSAQAAVADFSHLYTDLGGGLAERLAETVLGATIGAQADALWETVGAITDHRESWSPLFVDAAAELTLLKSAAMPLFEAPSVVTALAAGDVIARLDRIRLPEPLRTDAWRVFGMDTERVHTPSYRVATVEPVRSPGEATRRAEGFGRDRAHDIVDTVFAVETRLRAFIEDRLAARHGADWWERGVPPPIRKSCARLKAMREGPRSLHYDLIAFASIDELRQIIVHPDNWDTVFAATFHPQVVVDAMFLLFAPVRNDGSHPRGTSDADYKDFLMAANWLLDRIDADQEA